MSYPVGRLSNVASAWPSNVDKHSVDGESPVRLCNYTDVYKNATISSDLNFMAATAKPEQIDRFRIRRGDTLITKDSETAADIGIPAFVEYEADDLVCGYHLAIVRPVPELVDPRFLFWVLSSQFVLEQWAVKAAGVTRVGIRSSDLNRVDIPLPPLAEQRAIADYLDRETAQIDQVIEKNQRLPQLLELRFNGALRRSVTCGLDLDTRLTQTHIPWFGESPAAWDVIPVKQVLQMEKKVVGATWDGIQLLSLTKRGIIQRDIDSGEGKFPESFETYQIVESGDLVFCHFDVDETPRTVGMSKQRGMITSAYTRYKVNNLRALPAYLEFYFKAIDNEKLYRPFYTGLRKVVPKQFFLQSKIALPNLKEQAEIVAYLTDLEESQMAVTKKIQEVNDLLTERRAALITAAVTGQIDVSQGRAT